MQANGGPIATDMNNLIHISTLFRLFYSYLFSTSVQLVNEYKKESKDNLTGMCPSSDVIDSDTNRTSPSRVRATMNPSRPCRGHQQYILYFLQREHRYLNIKHETLVH